MKKDAGLKERIKDFLDSDSGYATATKVVLAVLALAGIVFIITTAPNVFQVFGRYKRSQRYSQKKIKRTIYSLRRRGFVRVIQEKEDKIKIELTNKGKKRIREFSIDALTIPKPKKWDKKWRIVIFDIPNRFNKARAALRGKLKELGFYQLQKSVWIYPYHCTDEILFVANIFNVEPFIEILTIEELLHENKIKKFFRL